LLLQQTAQLGIGRSHRMLQPIRGEHQRALLGIEAQRSLEEAAEWPGIQGLAVGKQDLDRLPIGTAQLAHDVDRNGHRAIHDLVCGLDSWRIDAVAKHRKVALHGQGGRRASSVQMKKAYNIAQRCSRVERMLCQVADQPERGPAAPLAKQESEMAAAGPRTG
jgi:hypothetical protein